MSRADRRFSVTVSGCLKRLRTSDGRVRCTSALCRAGISGYGDAAVTHRKPPCAYSDRNLKIYENLLAKGEKLDARGSYY